MKIGVLSDTHGVLADGVLDALRGVQAILHAGDVGKPDVLRSLETVAPVYAVRGNVDHFPGAERLPLQRIEPFGDVRIAITHGHQYGRPQARHWELRRTFEPFRVHAIVYGHSHEVLEDRTDKVVVFNPGSAGPARFGSRPTLALFSIDGETIDIDLIQLPPGA